MKKKKNMKKILGVAVILIMILLLVIGCSGFTRGEVEPAETTEPIETSVPEEITVPVEETTPVVVSSEPTEEPTSPTKPEETVPPTTEVAVTEPPATEPPATEAPKVQHTHSYSSKRKEPTCSADGVTTYTCTGCGYSYTEEIPATGHVWSSWTVIVAATSENEGSQSRTCGNCGYEQTQTIAKLPAVTEPPMTEPKATEPPATNSADTEPPVTEPIVTEPVGCSHNWEMIYHPEKSHTESCKVCMCGFVFTSFEEWNNHQNGYSADEVLLNHTGWGEIEKVVIDSPEYTEWICSKCGSSTTSQP